VLFAPALTVDGFAVNEFMTGTPEADGLALLWFRHNRLARSPRG
jgi:hypothetical protein